MQIDINNVCGHGCLYCTKYIRHLREDQKMQMTLEEIERALISLNGWPHVISLTGGEPLNHPDVPAMLELVRKYVPKVKAGLFTSHKAKHEKYRDIIDQTFGMVFINLHTEEQKQICLHQQNLLAVGDMVPDAVTRRGLINNCWCNEMWSPIVGKNGAFFCDAAIGIDRILDMDGGWPIEPNWWMRESYLDQMDKYCRFCGICLPYPRQPLTTKEKISKNLYNLFQERKLKNLDDMEVISTPLTNEDIGNNLCGWEPWRNRQDREYEGPAYYNK